MVAKGLRFYSTTILAYNKNVRQSFFFSSVEARFSLQFHILLHACVVLILQPFVIDSYG